MDPEPGIRTNTTICLGKIAKHLSENVSNCFFFFTSILLKKIIFLSQCKTRKKVLISAFTRSLRDTFHHARVAALMALNGNTVIG